MKLQNGWHTIDNNTYHKELEGVGGTSLVKFERSEEHGAIEEEDDDSERFGSVVHAAILEPEEFKKFYIEPKVDKRTKEGKLQLEIFQKNLPDGARVTSKDYYDRAVAIREKLNKHPRFQSLVKKPHVNEVAGVYHDAKAIYKIKPDMRFGNIIADLKTTNDARLPQFTTQVLKLGYDLKAAFYLDVSNLIEGKNQYDTFLWIVVEDKPPHGIMIYEVSKEWLEIGRKKYKKALDSYISLLETGVAKGYPEDIVIAVPPMYAMFD